jgi:elongation factor Ts
MAEITASMVKNLRERSGLPMMDCKKALMQTGGDEEAAMEMLRKSGAATAEKKAGRATSEGRIGVCVDADKKVGALVELNCETAPVANNPEFKALADKIARHVALTGHTDPKAIASEPFVDDPEMTVGDVMHDVLNRLRENMLISRAVFMPGHVAAYVHHTGKIGVLLEYENGTDNAEVLNDVCMHIAAMRPDAVNRQDMPEALVAQEQEIFREQIKASGKPDELVDKILVGKMNKFYAERVLLEQPFVKDDKKSVGDVLKGAGVTVRAYTRLVVGE